MPIQRVKVVSICAIAVLCMALPAVRAEDRLVGPAVLDGDTTLVPLRELGEWLGAVVEWVAPHITLSKGSLRVELKLGSTKAMITDGGKRRQLTMARAARTHLGSTFVPLRFVAEALGVTVEYRAQDSVVALTAGERTATLAVPNPNLPARFTVGLQDAAGVSYEVRIFANDEQLTVTNPDQATSSASGGDRNVGGLWQVTLRKQGTHEHVAQDLLLFQDTNRGWFNIERNMVFVVPGGKQQPSLLVVEQYAGSSNDDAWVFGITGGQLRRLAYFLQVRTEPYRLHGTGPLGYRSTWYCNADGTWRIDDWRFNPSRWTFAPAGERSVPNSKMRLEDAQ